MVVHILSAFFLALPLCAAIHLAPQAEDSPLPFFEINLDLPPRQRWKEVARAGKDFYLGVLEKRIAFFNKFNRTMVEKVIEAQQIDREYIEELEGFLEEINEPRATLELAIFGQMKYEMGFTQKFECSGVVAANEDGTVVQGRNLDLDPGQDWGKAGMIQVNFTRGGKTVLTAPMGYGLIGVATAYQPGGWSVQQNTRAFSAKTRRQMYWQVLDSARLGGKLFGLELRNIFTRTSDFSTAVDIIKKTPWTATSYFVLAGPKKYEGAVITVAAKSKEPDWSRVDYIDPKHGVWFLAQTNDDSWEPAKDPRRATAEFSMARWGQRSHQKDSVWATMRTFPVCNPGTWFTWMVTPATGDIRFTRARCPGPPPVPKQE